MNASIAMSVNQNALTEPFRKGMKHTRSTLTNAQSASGIMIPRNAQMFVQWIASSKILIEWRRKSSFAQSLKNSLKAAD
jgi:hypothetical protein